MAPVILISFQLRTNGLFRAIEYLRKVLLELGAEAELVGDGLSVSVSQIMDNRNRSYGGCATVLYDDTVRQNLVEKLVGYPSRE